MCECGEGHHGHGHCHGWGYGSGGRYSPRGGYGRSYEPGFENRDDVIDDLRGYKENLEAEIRRLEKRIGSLRDKSPSE
jgi:hypothetical protein